MGMVVRTNSMAINANRQLGMNQSNVQKSLEKLSSGFKINRAADDASGLAISEKMKAQIKGLDQAASNSQDGISLIQTAEGATTEIHDMLNRMVELATKSANGTIKNEVDREAIQKEVDDLNTEITRIAQSTNFNGINLLDGSLKVAEDPGFKTESIGANALLPTDANPVVGTNTVLHADSKTQVNPELTIDLSALNFDFVVDDANNTVSLSIAGQTFTTDKLAADTDADALATALAAKINANASGVDDTDGNDMTGIKIGDVVYKATAADGKITLAVQEKHPAFAAGADIDVNVDVTVSTAQTDATKGSMTGTVNDGSLSIKQGVIAQTGTLANTEFKLTADMVKNGQKLQIGSETFVFAVGADSTVAAGDGEKLIDLKDIDVTDAAALIKNAADRISGASAGNTVFTIGHNGTDGTISLQEITGGSTAEGVDLTTAEGIAKQINVITKNTMSAEDAAKKPLTLQIGDTNDDFNKVSVSVDDLSAEGIGTAGLDVSNQDAAGDAIKVIKDAINQVSTNRANLGSLQNRLEHTINNLNVTSENMTAANSAIRDTDMAKEMMNYTKMNVLTQAAQAMLAQANQQPQAILQLLQ